ncbi:MAG: hypothetical protein ACXQTK_00020 [Candidatus Syntropharchaeales archaeon]
MVWMRWGTSEILRFCDISICSSNVQLLMMARGVLFCMIGALTVVPRYWL